MFKRVDRYLARTVAQATALTWLTLLVLLMVLEFVAELRAGRQDYGPLQGIWFVLLTTPRNAVMVFPLAALVGTLLGAGGLAAQLELIAFRAAGISRLRLAVSVLIGALLLLLPVLLLSEYVVPELEHQARAYRVTKQSGSVHLGGTNGIWVREGSRIVNIRRPIIATNKNAGAARFSDVNVFELDQKLALVSLAHADEARSLGGGWELSEVTETLFTPEQVINRFSAVQEWQIELDPGLLEAAITRPRYLSIRALSDYAGYLSAHDQDSRSYINALWEKLAYPFTVLALVLSGMPFLFGSSRQNTLGVRIFTGVLVGATYIIMARLVENFADAYSLPAWLGAFFPVLVLASISVFALKRHT